jgi:hypothetical protein
MLIFVEVFTIQVEISTNVSFQGKKKFIFQENVLLRLSGDTNNYVYTDILMCGLGRIIK